MRMLLAGAAVAVLLGGAAGRAGTAPRFSSSVTRISPALASRLVSWHAGCPVPLSQLRVVYVRHWGFDHRVHTGRLMVRDTAAAPIVGVMRRLFAIRYPIRRMQLVDAYGADDWRSIEHDNTSAFNCRNASGSSHWSQHAYGQAIDLNPIENPYVTAGGHVDHKASVRFVDRSVRAPGVIHDGDAVVRAFRAAGWGWGGTWSGTRDYQHFSVTGS